MKTTLFPRRIPSLLFLAALLVAGCATHQGTSPVVLLSPGEGAVVPTLSEGQKAYLALPREERVKKFADEKYRAQMKALGYYPLPLALSWTNTATVAEPVECAVKLFRQPDGAVVFSTNFTSAATSGSVLVDNLEIARPYRWKVTAGGSSATGHFTTEDIAPRLIRLPGVPNVRDFGGRVGLDGRRVKQGLVYRSAGLNDNASTIYFTEKELLARDPSMARLKKEIDADIARWRGLESALKTNETAIPLVDAKLSGEWTLFRPVLDRDAYPTNAAPLLAKLDAIPAEFLGAKAEKVSIQAGERHDFGKESARGPAILMQEFTAPADGYLALTAGGDYWWEIRCNGESVFDLVTIGNWRFPYNPDCFAIPLPVKKGRNLVAVALFTGEDTWSWGWDVLKTEPSALAKDMARIREKRKEPLFTKVKKSQKKGKNRLKGAALDYALHTMGIRSDIDLRSDGECWGMTGSPLGDSVTWFHYSSGQYASMQAPWGRDAFTKVFRVFLDKKNYPIDFHCIAGQDRTGAVAFILNGLLGVEEEELFRDWEATGFWNGSAGFNHEKRFNLLYDGFKNWPGETINERIEAYVLDLGFTKRDIARFREIMLEK